MHAPIDIYKLQAYFSLEPGYYKEGEFGIRIENVVEVKSSKSKGDFNGLGGLCMEPVTLCPIQKKLIHVPSLTSHEVCIYSPRTLAMFL